MYIRELFAVANPYEFTGFEHSRIVGLLTVLTFVSVAMWILVGVALIVRKCAILIIGLVGFVRSHPLPTVKKVNRNNGS